MQFGFTLKPDHTIERTLALTRQAEDAGFAYGWLFDSHVLWRDPYPLLTLMAGATERLRLGTCVTNPGTREPTVTASVLATLDEISGGRMDLGIGRGDSARRVLGKPPITLAHTEEAIRVIRALVAGERIEYEGTELHFPWTAGWTLPVWVAGYGPMALAMTGRVADGIILQLGGSGPHPLVRRPGPRRGRRRRARSQFDLDPGRGTGACRAPGRRARSDALVPRARVEPRGRPREQVPARTAAGRPDGLHRGSRGLRLHTTTPRSDRPMRPSSATR